MMSPHTRIIPVFAAVWQETCENGSNRRWASKIASLTWSHILSENTHTNINSMQNCRPHTSYSICAVFVIKIQKIGQLKCPKPGMPNWGSPKGHIGHICCHEGRTPVQCPLCRALGSMFDILALNNTVLAVVVFVVLGREKWFHRKTVLHCGGMGTWEL